MMAGQCAPMHVGNRAWSRLSVWIRPGAEGVLVIYSSSRARTIGEVLRESAVSSPHGIRGRLLVGCSPHPSEFFVCGCV
jgi:hypothetical protein